MTTDSPDPHARALAAVDELAASLKALELPYLGKPSTLATAHSKPLKAVRESVELHRDAQAG
jgi:hypothetical protein